jgi:hypothetical protein
MQDQDHAPATQIGHILFLDIPRFSLLSTEEQAKAVQALRRTALSAPELVSAREQDRALLVPYPGALAVVFVGDPVSPARCAAEVRERADGASIRMGIHTGPFTRSAEDGAESVTGTGLNAAQQLALCARAQQILVGAGTAELLAQLDGWKPRLRDLGTRPGKHGAALRVFALDENEQAPVTAPGEIVAELKSGPLPKTAVALVKSNPIVRSGVACFLCGLLLPFLQDLATAQANFAGQWFPGIFFGLVWAVMHFRSASAVVSFATLSGCIFYGVVEVGFKLGWGAPGYLFALCCGAPGAAALAVTAKLFSDVALEWRSVLKVAAVGAAALYVMMNQVGSVQMMFAVWQAAVGAAMTASIVGKPQVRHRAPFEERLNGFLQGPLVQLLGFIGTVIGLISLFKK